VAYRFATHSTGSRESRPTEETDYWQARCPIQRLAHRLCDSGLLTAEQIDRIRAEVAAAAEEAIRAASAAPYPSSAEALADVV
jgi:pyruvate dehydrogenase E1 component alpha subunit